LSLDLLSQSEEDAEELDLEEAEDFLSMFEIMGRTALVEDLSG
jgi:hypothetical protein